VRGPLHKDGSGSLQGSYEGKPVELDCVKPHAFTNIRCDVYISGRKVETLTFKPGARQTDSNGSLQRLSQRYVIHIGDKLDIVNAQFVTKANDKFCLKGTRC